MAGDRGKDRAELLAEMFGEGVPTALTGRLLRTREVAGLFQVSERTVAEWARRGRISSVRTLGGHYLFPIEQVRARLLELHGTPDASALRPPTSSEE